MPHAPTLPHLTRAPVPARPAARRVLRHVTDRTTGIMVEGPKEVVAMRNLARVLRIVGLVLISLFAAFGILFAAGYAFEDPGGWQGAAIVACMVVPLAVLTWLARSHPAAGLRWFLVGAVRPQ